MSPAWLLGFGNCRHFESGTFWRGDSNLEFFKFSKKQLHKPAGGNIRTQIAGDNIDSALTAHWSLSGFEIAATSTRDISTRGFELGNFHFLVKSATHACWRQLPNPFTWPCWLCSHLKITKISNSELFSPPPGWDGNISPAHCTLTLFSLSWN